MLMRQNVNYDVSKDPPILSCTSEVQAGFDTRFVTPETPFQYTGIPTFRTSEENENWFEKWGSLRNGRQKCSVCLSMRND